MLFGAAAQPTAREAAIASAGTWIRRAGNTPAAHKAVDQATAHRPIPLAALPISSGRSRTTKARPSARPARAGALHLDAHLPRGGGRGDGLEDQLGVPLVDRGDRGGRGRGAPVGLRAPRLGPAAPRPRGLRTPG